MIGQDRTMAGDMRRAREDKGRDSDKRARDKTRHWRKRIEKT